MTISGGRRRSASRRPAGSNVASKSWVSSEKTTSDRRSASQIRTVPSQLALTTRRRLGSTPGRSRPVAAVAAHASRSRDSTCERPGRAAAHHLPAVGAEARRGDGRLQDIAAGASPPADRPVLAAADDRVGARHERGAHDGAPVAPQLVERGPPRASNTRTTPSSPAVTSRLPSALKCTDSSAWSSGADGRGRPRRRRPRSAPPRRRRRSRRAARPG